MKQRVYIDSSVFIIAKEFQNSNSAKILELLIAGEFHCIISEKVLLEVINYFRKKHGKDIASDYRNLLLKCCSIVTFDEIINDCTEWKGKIKDKDIEHIATIKKYGISLLIAYDRDFKPFNEYRTPKAFLEESGMPASREDY